MFKFKKMLAAVSIVVCMTALLIPTASAAEDVAAVETEGTTLISSSGDPTNLIGNLSTENSLPDKSKDVTLTITSMTADKKLVSGVEYSIYCVSDDLNNIPEVSEVNKEKCEKITLPLTDISGKTTITLKGEQQGVYLVSCTDKPKNVSKVEDDFIITLPWTLDGSEWKYEIEATPKVILEEETEPTTAPPSTPKTNGDMNASAGSGTKGTAITGDSAVMIIIPVAGACILSLAVVVIAATRKKNKK